MHSYGSRHLAAKMADTAGVNGKVSALLLCLVSLTVSQTELQNIELFVLLDLVGAPNAAFHSFFEKTDHKFDLLVAVEQRLRKLKL